MTPSPRHGYRWLFVTLMSVLYLWGGLAIASAPPAPLLWKVQGEAGTVYLLGSFHLLKKDDYPLHPTVEAAYAEADQLVFEIDPKEMADPDTLAMIGELARFSDGRTLAEVVSADTLKKLQTFMGGNEAALAAAMPYKPWYLGMNLSVGMMTSLGLDPQLGLDQHFMQRAARDNKLVRGLETAADQMRALDRAPMAEQESMLSESLAPMGEVKPRIFAMHDAWRSADTGLLEALINEEMGEKTPQLFKLLQHDRNQQWLPHLIDMLSEKKTRLVVVGAMHLLGEEGLVKQLQQKGIRVQRVDSAPKAIPEAA